LEELSTRAVVRYLAGMDMDDMMGPGRLQAAGTLRSDIQAAANQYELGAKIVFVGLQDIHPPTTVASAYENVVSAAEERIATNDSARAYAITTTTITAAQAYATNQLAQATEMQLTTLASANAALFTNQIPEFEAAPNVYEQRVYFRTLADATRNTRKYVLLVTNTYNVYYLDLEQKIAADLENVPVNQ
jgi:membrane protease subunit HflK